MAGIQVIGNEGHRLLQRLARKHVRTMGIVLLLVIAGIQCSGCVSTPPEIRYYDFVLTPPEALEDTPSGDRFAAVQIVEVRTPEHLDDRRIFYRSSSIEAGHYEYHQWIRSPSEVLATETARYLEATQGFEQVKGPLDLRDPKAIHVKIRVEDFHEEDFDRGGIGSIGSSSAGEASGDEASWHARVGLHVTVSNLAGGSEQSRRIREVEPVGKRNAKGVAVAINSALDRALQEATQFVLDTCNAQTGSKWLKDSVSNR